MLGGGRGGADARVGGGRAGAVHTRDPASRASLPFATPAIVTNLLRLVDRPRAFTVVGVFVLLGTRLWDPSWAVTPFGVVNTVLPALAVLYLRARSDLLDSLRERAERAEREQVLLAERARAEAGLLAHEAGLITEPG